MASQFGNGVLRAALSAAASPCLTDRELLAQFSAGDQAAFAAIVKRHTGLVLGVCRRVLPTVQDAEDACQATFLVLARKAKTGKWQSSIANWLYTTARRIASETNRAATRRMRREAHLAPPIPASALDEMTGREAFAALDEELDKLPAIYREPLVLCYLQGLTRDEAASRLGIPSATLKSQLDRGRKKLADALTKRGIDIGAGLIAVGATSSAGASSRLVESILATAGGSPSASVAAIVKGAAMNGFALKATLLALAVVAIAGTGFGLVSTQIMARPHKAAIERTKQSATKEEAKSNQKSKAEPLVGAQPLETEGPKSYQGLTASLSIANPEHKADESLEVTVTFTCTTDAHRLFNPFFNGLLEQPGRLVVRDSKGKVVNKLLEFHEGSRRTPGDGDYVRVGAKGFVGGKLTVYPGRQFAADPLPPGDYTLQLEVHRSLLNPDGDSDTKVIANSECVRFRIVK
jgi:RNA polymerase sigma factor (sigma-70 family)